MEEKMARKTRPISITTPFACVLAEILEKRLPELDRTDADFPKVAATHLKLSHGFVRSVLLGTDSPSDKSMKDIVRRLFPGDMQFDLDRDRLLTEWVRQLDLAGIERVLPRAPQPEPDPDAELAKLLGFPNLGVDTPRHNARRITEILAKGLVQCGEESVPLQILALYAESRAHFLASVDRKEHRPLGNDPSDSFYASLHRGEHFVITMQATTSREVATLSAPHRHTLSQIDFLVAGHAWLWTAPPSKGEDEVQLTGEMLEGNACFVPGNWWHAIVAQNAIKICIEFDEEEFCRRFEGASWHRREQPYILGSPPEFSTTRASFDPQG
jgi:hypothetical protein